jgi:hypothetical protein
MNKKEIEMRINSLVARKEENDKITDKLYDLVGENNIEETVWSTFDDYVDAVEELVGDTHRAISFFLFDCECGESPRTTGDFPKFKKVKDVVKFIKGK